MKESTKIETVAGFRVDVKAVTLVVVVVVG